MSDCNCNQTFRTAEDFRDHLPCLPTARRMTSNDYQQLALRSEKTEVFIVSPFPHEDGLDNHALARLSHAVLGAGTEAGELQDLVKKFLIYGKQFPKTKVLDEAGDVMWYLAVALDACGFTIEQAMEANIAKLQKRFPDRFDRTRAIQRDEKAELAAVEAVAGAQPHEE